MTNSTGRGHGGRNGFDQGAVGNGTTEYKEVSWVNDQFLARTKWADVSDFSASSVNQNLVNIVANTNNVSGSNELTFSNHQNAFNNSATGVEVWYYAGDSKGRSLAENLSSSIANALGLQNRGAKATTGLYVVNNTNATCLLIEWCFVDNANDMAKWRANKGKAVDAALRVLGFGGSTPAPKPVKRETPQGPWMSENKRVTVDKEAHLYSGFNWSFRQKGEDLGRRQLNVTGKYEHENGQTYYSVYNDNGQWEGYINSGYTKEVPKNQFNLYTSPQGQWKSEDKRVIINDKNANIYSGFDWKTWYQGKDACNQVFKVEGRYDHANGYSYYSLYDDKGTWKGYINAGFTSELK